MYDCVRVVRCVVSFIRLRESSAVQYVLFSGLIRGFINLINVAGGSSICVEEPSGQTDCAEDKGKSMKKYCTGLLNYAKPNSTAAVTSLFPSTSSDTACSFLQYR